MTEIAKKRPEFRNINALSDLPGYRWPLAALVSGMHRASGVILFLLLPFIVWMLDTSLSSEISFGEFKAAFNSHLGFAPGWLVTLMTLVLIWAYLHHFVAGIRHLIMDINHAAVNKDFGRQSAATVYVLSLTLTLVLGLKLFGVY